MTELEHLRGTIVNLSQERAQIVCQLCQVMAERDAMKAELETLKAKKKK